MNWLSRIKNSLKKSSSQLTEGISAILYKRKLDQNALDAIEELLITSDMGVVVAANFKAYLAKTRFSKEVSDNEIKEELANFIQQNLQPYEQKIRIDNANKPHIILMVGVNGSGKTTTIGKLAKTLQNQNLKVKIAACDTFRAAAVEQLELWANLNNVKLVKGPAKSDPASVAFQAIESAQNEHDDVLIIDTAGRLHNKADLMAELGKIIKVIKKHSPQAPHHCILILDATLGQNLHAQVQYFQQTAGVNGLIMTKLDGTAKGGTLVGLSQQFKLPIYAVGLGEGVNDLQDFNAHDFAHGLVGLTSCQEQI